MQYKTILKLEGDLMNIPVADIKSLLITNGLHDAGASGDSLEKLAQEISESVKEIKGTRGLADAIYGNFTASGINFRNVDNLMGIAEKIADTISASHYIE